MLLQKQRRVRDGLATQERGQLWRRGMEREGFSFLPSLILSGYLCHIRAQPIPLQGPLPGTEVGRQLWHLCVADIMTSLPWPESKQNSEALWEFTVKKVLAGEYPGSQQLSEVPFGGHPWSVSGRMIPEEKVEIASSSVTCLVSLLCFSQSPLPVVSISKNPVSAVSHLCQAAPGPTWLFIFQQPLSL